MINGFGLGLRPQHYVDLDRDGVGVDWLEIISENYMVGGGRPLDWLDRLRARYPMVMHGVSLSIGGTDPLNPAYLDELAALAQRVQPVWISDHLCWTGIDGVNLHDLMPLPYTDEALAHVADRIGRVQDRLRRPLVIENVSSYVTYRISDLSEPQFLAELVARSGCDLLLDVNNVFVSAFNHGFDPLAYLDHLPARAIRQIHLAGHSDQGSHIIDTHDAPVAPAVFDLYAQAVRRFGVVPTMIERDDNIPPLAELLAELDETRRQTGLAMGETPSQQAIIPAQAGIHGCGKSEPIRISTTADPGLRRIDTVCDLQRIFSRDLLGDTGAISPHVNDSARTDRVTLAGVYRHAYGARLVEVLGNDFPATATLMGGEAFEAAARAHIAAHPSTAPSVRWLGRNFPASLGNAAAADMAAFEWALGLAFDGAEVTALSPQVLAALPAEAWDGLRITPRPTTLCLELSHAVPDCWQEYRRAGAIQAPPRLEGAGTWVIWRHGLEVQYRRLEPDEAVLFQRLSSGAPLGEALADLDPGTAIAWLAGWCAAGLVSDNST